MNKPLLSTVAALARNPVASPPPTQQRPPSRADAVASLPDLPAWADTLRGRLLLSTILEERPERDRFASSDSAWPDKYSGKTAARLRWLFNEQLDALCRAERALYEARKPHRHLTDEVNAFLLQERPDALVARLLGEAL